MANVESIRIPERIHKALMETHKGKISPLVKRLLQEFLDGKRSIPEERKDPTRSTSIAAERSMLDQAREKLQEKGMSLNKAIVLMLEAELADESNKRGHE